MKSIGPWRFTAFMLASSLVSPGILLADVSKQSKEALDKLLAQKGTSIAIVLALQVSARELVKRLLNRGLTSGRSDDRDEQTIRSRHAEYEKKTAAVADYYNQYGKLVFINGEGDVDQIFQSLCREIDLRDRA